MSQTDDAHEILFINQGGGAMFRDLVLSAHARFGRVVFVTAEPPGLFDAAVHVVSAVPNDNRSTVARLSGWLRYLTVAFRDIWSRPRGTLLFIVTNPPPAPLLGALAKKWRGQRYVLLYYDIYPEALERFSGLSPQSPLSGILRAVNRLAISQADRVFTISEDMAATLRKYPSVGSIACSPVIIPTWVNVERIRPMAKSVNWFAQKHGQVDKLTVLYSGNMGQVHDLSMLPAIAERLAEYPDIHFMLISDGAKRAELEADCRRRRLTNVTILPLQPEEVLPYTLACGDIGIVSLAAGAEGISMPSKTYFTMAAGSALVGLSSRDSDLAKVIRRFDCGVNVLPGDVDAAVSALLSYHSQRALLERHRSNARLAAETHYSHTVCVSQMLETLQEVMGA